LHVNLITIPPFLRIIHLQPIIFIMGKKKDGRFELTELYLVKADWHRTFIGSIERKEDKDGNPIVLGKVVINEGMVYGMAENEEKLGEYLDAICVMKLDHGLHQDAGVFTEICDTEYFLKKIIYILIVRLNL